MTGFVGLSASQTITYGQAAVLLSGKLAADSAVPSGQSVTIAVGAASVDATVMPDGSFSALVDTHALAASTTPYLVRFSYPGDSDFQPAGDASTTLTVNRGCSAWSHPARPFNAGAPSPPSLTPSWD